MIDRDFILVCCRAALFVIAYLNKRYELKLRVPAVDLTV